MTDLDPQLSFGEFDAVSFSRWKEVAERTLGASLEGARARGGGAVAPLFADDDRPAGARPLWARAGWGVGQEIAAEEVGEIAARIEEARGGLGVAWVELDGALRAGCAPQVPWVGARPTGARALAPLVEAARASGVAVVVRADAAAPELLAAWCELEASARSLAGVVSDPLGTLAQLGARGSSLVDAHARLADTTRAAIEIHARANVATSRGSETHGLARDPTLPDRGTCMGRPIVTVLADGVLWHDAGASASVALGAALAAGLAHLGGLAAHGVAPAEAAPHVALRLSLGTDLLETIAMLRAARLVWDACLQRLGVATEPRIRPRIWPRIWARTSWRDRSRLDLPVNLLRGTLEAFAGAVGGVEQLYVQPHTEACGRDDADARRWARNIQHLLQGESRLDVVADPAAGSPYLEHLTRAIASEAWEVARSLSTPDPEAALVAALHSPGPFLRAAPRVMVGVDLHPDPQPPAPHTTPHAASPTSSAAAPVVAAPALPRERPAAAYERVRERATAWATRLGPAAAISIAPDTARTVRDAAARLAALLGVPVREAGIDSALRIDASTEAPAVLRIAHADTDLELAAILDRGVAGLDELLDRLEATP